jgi:hypothetical protein
VGFDMIFRVSASVHAPDEAAVLLCSAKTAGLANLMPSESPLVRRPNLMLQSALV